MSLLDELNVFFVLAGVEACLTGQLETVIDEEAGASH